MKVWDRAENLAEHLRLNAGMSSAGPLDPFAMADRFGIAVVHQDIPEDGLLLPRADGWTIILRRDTPLERQRFTLGHELTHAALRSPRIGGRAAEYAQGVDGFRSAERLCDCTSASLLMPRSLVMEVDRRGHPGQLQQTRNLAAAAGTSLSAAFVRLHGLWRWNSALVQWRMAPRGWLLSCEVGIFGNRDAPSFDQRIQMFLSEVHATSPRGLVRRSFIPIKDGRVGSVEEAETIVSAETITAVMTGNAPRGSGAGRRRHVEV